MAMMGSDKSPAYWQQLRIPVKLSAYDAASKYCRACLEPVLDFYIAQESNIVDAGAIWKTYLEQAILSDEIRKCNVEHVHDLHDGQLFKSVAEELQFSGSDFLFHWAKENFRFVPDRTVDAALLIEKALTGSADKCGLDPQITEQLRSFYMRIKWRNASLISHFEIARNVYRMTLPTVWEMILQDCFYESTRSAYWWMDSVEYTLQYMFFRSQWELLKLEVKDVGLIVKKLYEETGKDSLILFDSESLSRLWDS